MRFWICIPALFIFIASAGAQVISPSGQEVSFQYSARFVLSEYGGSPEDQALDHSQYMFGVLHSPSVVDRYGLDPDWLEGIGGARLPLTIRVNSVTSDEEGREIVSYQAFGRLLLHKQVVRKLRSTLEIPLQLPFDISRIYLKKCTDSHYDSFSDYWYFWDPYRDGCERLRQPHISREVVLKLRLIESQPSEQSPNLNRLRGDNGNGDVLRVYVLNGFNESSSVSADEGRINFEQIRQTFIDRGFEVENVDRSPRIPRNLYTKSIRKNDKIMHIEVIHQLANTDISSDAITFARSFQEAVNEGDIIAYLGHSGLGGNLDIPSLSAKLERAGDGAIEFPQDKYQIFFFDSCSSYSYYLPHFREMKTKGKIDILSYGLSSLFENSAAVFAVFIDRFLHLNQAQSWESILRSMEEPLGKQTFLLNVGGV